MNLHYTNVTNYPHHKIVLRKLKQFKLLYQVKLTLCRLKQKKIKNKVINNPFKLIKNSQYKLSQKDKEEHGNQLHKLKRSLKVENDPKLNFKLIQI